MSVAFQLIWLVGDVGCLTPCMMQVAPGYLLGERYHTMHEPQFLEEAAVSDNWTENIL